MRDSTREEELTKFARALNEAFRQAAPAFKVAIHQMGMVAESLKSSMKAFGAELNKILDEDDDDGDKVGAKK